MAIPNVTMRWCRKPAKCQWCQEQVKVSEAMVVVFYWNKGDDGRRWNVQQCFHPDCWLKQGLDYLNRNPFVPHIRGRKTMELSIEDKRKRFLITRKYHAILQRLGKMDEGVEPLEILQLEMRIPELMSQMLEIGGVPKKWLLRL